MTSVFHQFILFITVFFIVYVFQMEEIRMLSVKNTLNF